MKNGFLLPLFLLAISCGHRNQSSSGANPFVPAVDYSGVLSVTVVTPPANGSLAKAYDMTHAKLQLKVELGAASRDTLFTLGASAVAPKLLTNVPVGTGVKVTANIFSQNDSLTHTGWVLTNIFAGETTAVACSTKALFGYLQIKIIELPQNVDSGYVKVSGNGTATVYAPLAIDQGDTLTDFDGTAQGLLEYIRVGTGRKADVYLLNAAGNAVYTGSATLDIGPGQNNLLTFTLVAQSAKLRVSVVEAPFDTASLVASPKAYAGAESGELILTEIMYNPQGADNNEWLEIHNTTSAPVDLTSFRLVIQTDTLPLSGTVPASGFFVVGESDSAYVDLKVPGGITLPNSGETTLALFNPAKGDTVSDHVLLRYETVYGWPSGTSSSGIAVALKKSGYNPKSNNFGQFWAKAVDTIPASNPVEKGTPGY